MDFTYMASELMLKSGLLARIAEGGHLDLLTRTRKQADREKLPSLTVVTLPSTCFSSAVPHICRIVVPLRYRRPL